MQGKSNEQYTASAKMTGFAIIGLIALIVIASMLGQSPKIEDSKPEPTDYWTPTEEDKMYLDSLHTIVNETKTNVDTISSMVDRCIEKLDGLEKKKEYHGKEGKSEYGEYEPYNEWMEKQ